MTDTSFNRLQFKKEDLIEPHIIYGGDSFIWGEGLDLYMDTPYWISERSKRNEWDQLFEKTTPESNKFRETNRFPGLIESKTGLKQIVDPTNGGDYQSSTDIVNFNLNESTNAVVYLFTSVDRNFLHSTMHCECEFCSDMKPKPFNLYFNYLSKIANNEPIDEWLQSKIDYLVKYENIPEFRIRDFDIHKMIQHMDTIFHNIRKRNIDYFVANHLKKWLKTHKVYLIDSWCQWTSRNYIHANPFIEKHLLPLKGYDNNWYKMYSEWERTFPHERMSHEFPGCQNGHPTLLQHQYLAESVITAMKKDLILFNNNKSII